MAALAVTNPTLLDLAKSKDPDGSTADLVEILNETNEVLDDMTVLEGNLPTGHRSTIAAGIPAPTWRALYGFVQPSKMTRVQVTDNCGELAALSQIDVKLAELDGGGASFLLQESRAHIEGISQEIADTLFYGNQGSEPDAFTGLAPRFNDTTADNGENIILGGSLSGQTDNASIWLIVWGPGKVHGITPKGSKAGIKVEELGKQMISDSSGGRMQVIETKFTQDLGLAVPDWRYIVRIPNIDKSLLTKDASSGADLPDLMFQAMNKVHSLSGGRPAFYMSRDLRAWLGRQTANKTANSTLTMDKVGGKMVTMFNEIPVKRCDALSADEARVA